MGRTSRGQGEGFKFIRAFSTYESDSCVIWPFFINPKGYGIVGHNGKMWRAHRLMCITAHGEPAPKHEAAHSCNNRACVNPKHLSWKTSTGNHLDQRAAGTQATNRTGHKGKLTQEQADAIRAAEGTKTQAEIAVDFGISADTVRRIHLGKTYAGRVTDWHAINKRTAEIRRLKSEAAQREAQQQYATGSR